MGEIVLSLAVTDATGATATDTVKHFAPPPAVLLDVTGTALFGTPLVQPRLEHPFTVPAGVGRLVATLDWGNPANDLDFELLRPDGSSATGGQAQTSAKPETASVSGPAPGAWKAAVYPFLSAPDTYRLRIESVAASPLPLAWAGGIWSFGQLDAQAMTGDAALGTAPYSFAWDLDGDGHLEASGKTATGALPAGEHVVTIRVTDAAGYEVEATAPVTISEADHVLRLQCGGDPRARWMMEFTSTKGTCWSHGGHHTYFTEANLYALRGLHGFVYTVEQQFAWPSEFTPTDPLHSPIVIELSRNGDEFRAVGNATYTLLDVPPDVLPFNGRQGLWFSFEVNGLGKQFRFLRAREPKSFTQGLSGYLDNSLLFAHVDLVRAVAPKPLAETSRALSCGAGDILEDFFAEHPCWFGGLDRYDSPSFWHTYYLGEGAQPARVNGSFTLLPWRADDFNQGRPAVDAAKTKAFVQTSADGVVWRDAAVVAATFGAPQTFDVTLDGSAARFVRLFPEYHARYDQTGSFPANHHPRGYFVGSEITVSGLLPEE